MTSELDLINRYRIRLLDRVNECRRVLRRTEWESFGKLKYPEDEYKLTEYRTWQRCLDDLNEFIRTEWEEGRCI